MGSTGVQRLNANADVMGSKAALFMNINAAGGLMDVMKTNLGPRGTIKMLVSGSGDIKLTKVRWLRKRAACAQRRWCWCV
jgi:T-complex protein 1 subunit zeta